MFGVVFNFGTKGRSTTTQTALSRARGRVASVPKGPSNSALTMFLGKKARFSDLAVPTYNEVGDLTVHPHSAYKRRRPSSQRTASGSK